jgi:integral membrane protein
VGPVHGGAFLVYIALVLVVTSAKPWTSLDSLKLLLAAFIPFGAWMVGGSFKRVATELATQQAPA